MTQVKDIFYQLLKNKDKENPGSEECSPNASCIWFCYQTPLVHQHMTKETTFYEK